MYFFMFIIFVVLLVAPIVAGKFLNNISSSIPMNLYQTHYDNNDTMGTTATGTGAAGGGATASASGGARLVRLF